MDFYRGWGEGRENFNLSARARRRHPWRHPCRKSAGAFIQQRNRCGVRTQAERRDSWRKSMLRTPRPKKGCFTATYPETAWREIRCKTPPIAPIRLEPRSILEGLPPGLWRIIQPGRRAIFRRARDHSTASAASRARPEMAPQTLTPFSSTRIYSRPRPAAPSVCGVMQGLGAVRLLLVTQSRLHPVLAGQLWTDRRELSERMAIGSADPDYGLLLRQRREGRFGPGRSHRLAQ